MNDQLQGSESAESKDKPPAKPPAQSPPPKPGKLATVTSILKEGIASILAVAIAVVGLWMLYDAYSAERGEPTQVTAQQLVDSVRHVFEVNEKRRIEREGDRKDLLLVAMGLLGSVLGYYFGRVPAERRAETAESAREQAETAKTDAEQQAAEQKQNAKEAQRQVQEARQTAREILEDLEPTTAPQRATLGGAQRDAPVAGSGVLEASVKLKELLKRLE